LRGGLLTNFHIYTKPLYLFGIFMKPVKAEFMQNENGDQDTAGQPDCQSH
jgi:hypothetical protein